MTVEEYIYFRTGTTRTPLVIRNMFLKPFVANSLRAFWNYWNPGYGYFLLFFCYQPLRSFLPHWLAFVLTFLICGLFHDVLYIIPIMIADGIWFVFPFVTVWFVIIAFGILISEALRIDFRQVNKMIRPLFHVGYLAGTFYLTRFLDLWIG